MKIISLLILSIYFSGGEALWWGSRCCDDIRPGLCFDKSGGYSAHNELPDCPSNYNPKFMLFTRTNRSNPQYVTKTSVPNLFSNNRRTVFIVHGWRDKIGDGFLAMKEQFLTREDMNVIAVDWRDGAGSLLEYDTAAANTRAVGALLGMVVNKLLEQPGSNKYMWCVGHSLGAHACGESNLTTNLDRITGMDPARHQFPNTNVGLNHTRAKQVDVIHTDELWGSPLPRGHVDFYPNGGNGQPGCLFSKDNLPISNANLTEAEIIQIWAQILDAQKSKTNDASTYGAVPGCDHARAVQYMTNSIRKTDCFKAVERCNCPTNSCTRFTGQMGVMGYAATSYLYSGCLRLDTAEFSPYCN